MRAACLMLASLLLAGCHDQGDLDRIAELETEVDSLQAQLDDANSERDDAQSKLDDAQGAASDLRSNFDRLQYEDWKDVAPDIDRTTSDVESAVQ